MTRFGPGIEPISSPMPSRCATCYATDAGFTYNYYTTMIQKNIGQWSINKEEISFVYKNHEKKFGEHYLVQYNPR